jgi:DNA repair protein RadC
MRNDFKSRANGLKPRERIESLGSAVSASAEELLAIILKTGAAGCDVMELSRRLIDAFGGIEELVRTDLNSLKAAVTDYNKRNPSRKILGLGRVKILELTAAFELARRGYKEKFKCSYKFSFNSG